VQLRDDQVQFMQQITEALTRAPHQVLAVAPTGSGKTVCFSALTKEWTQADLYTRVMILVHRRELLAQVSTTLTAWGVEHGLIAPGAPNHKTRRVQIASVQTLVHRLADYAPPDYIIIDEAHHAIMTSSWGKVLTAWPHAKRLGVTATPQRLSGEPLRGIFSTLVVGPSVKSLMAAGALSTYRLFAPPVHHADKITRRMGDYSRKELSETMNTSTITGDAVQHYHKIAHGKRTMVFCVSVAHAQKVADKFTEAGNRAFSIDGTMSSSHRRSLIAAFTSGEITVLTSCDLVSEGFDLPAVEVAILLRPTQSLALHLQQVGRALRPYPGKVAAIILDHAGNSQRHGLPDDERLWSLDGHVKHKKSDNDEIGVSTKTCPRCYAVMLTIEPTCLECGHEFQSERKIVQVEGTLIEVDLVAARKAARRDQGEAITREDLIALGRARNYRWPHLWAEHVLAARKGPVKEQVLYALPQPSRR